MGGEYYCKMTHKQINEIANNSELNKYTRIFLLGRQYGYADYAYWNKLINKQERKRIQNHCTKMARKVSGVIK